MAEATEAVQRAADAVDDALMIDGESVQARLALRAATDLLQQAKAHQLQADQAAAAQARRAEQHAIADQSGNTQAAFEQAVSVIELVDGIEVDDWALPPVVAAAAADVAREQVALAAAQPVVAAAMTARAAVADRVAPKSALMSEIAARRVDGDEREGDAAEVSLLEQDLAALNAKLVPLQAQVTEALTVVAQRQEVLGQLERALKGAQRKAELEAMANRVRVLEAHFCVQIRTLRLAAEARGLNNFGSTFLPSQILRDVAHGVRI